MRRFAVPLLFGLLLAAFAARGQEASDLIVTGGTVARDPAGADLAYLRWSADDVSLLEGRTFAVWSRPGPPAANGPATRRGFVFPATSSAAAEAALAWAARLGQGRRIWIRSWEN